MSAIHIHQESALESPPENQPTNPSQDCEVPAANSIEECVSVPAVAEAMAGQARKQRQPHSRESQILPRSSPLKDQKTMQAK